MTTVVVPYTLDVTTSDGDSDTIDLDVTFDLGRYAGEIENVSITESITGNDVFLDAYTRHVVSRSAAADIHLYR